MTFYHHGKGETSIIGNHENTHSEFKIALKLELGTVLELDGKKKKRMNNFFTKRCIITSARTVTLGQ